MCMRVFAFIYAMQIGMYVQTHTQIHTYLLYAFVIIINFRNVYMKNAEIDAKHRRTYLHTHLRER